MNSISNVSSSSVRNGWIISEVSNGVSDISIISNVSTVGNVSIVRSVSSLNNVSIVCNKLMIKKVKNTEKNKNKIHPSPNQFNASSKRTATLLRSLDGSLSLFSEEAMEKQFHTTALSTLMSFCLETLVPLAAFLPIIHTEIPESADEN